MRGRNARIGGLAALATALSVVVLGLALLHGDFAYRAFPDPPKRALISEGGADAGPVVSARLGSLPFASGGRRRAHSTGRAGGARAVAGPAAVKRGKKAATARRASARRRGTR